MRARVRHGAGLWAAASLALAVAACTRGGAEPARLDPLHDGCASCRMAVSDPRTAAQLAAPGEEPAFFDDIGCLRDYLASGRRLPRGAVAFVADHRTKAWVRAAAATFTRQEAVETPMGSHLLAHADPASRDADPAAAGGKAVSPTDLFGPRGPPDGR